MAQFIVNPRRAPRAPARCRTAVVTATGAFESHTEDIGTEGCQLVAPRLIRKGDAVQLTITNERVAEPLRVAGRVAWVSPQAPWRVGVAFDEGSVRDSTRWFGKLAASLPGMAEFRRVPDRIAVDAMVYLGPPPRFLVDFSADEAMLLRAIASGARIDELQARLHDRWDAAQRALFSLIARQAVTLSRGQAVHPDAWKQILTQVEASLAIESLAREGASIAVPPPAPVAVPPASAAAPPPPPPPRGPRTSSAPDEGPVVPDWSAAPPQDPSRMIELPDEEGPPLELATLEPAKSAPPSPRSAEAQAAYDRARSENLAGNVAGALALLRRALQLSPGDPEIGEALGRLAFDERDRRTR